MFHAFLHFLQPPLIRPPSSQIFLCKFILLNFCYITLRTSKFDMKPLLTEISRAITLNLRPFLLLRANIEHLLGLFDEYFINSPVLSKINPPSKHIILSSLSLSLKDRERERVLNIIDSFEIYNVNHLVAIPIFDFLIQTIASLPLFVIGACLE